MKFAIALLFAGFAVPATAEIYGCPDEAGSGSQLRPQHFSPRAQLEASARQAHPQLGGALARRNVLR